MAAPAGNRLRTLISDAATRVHGLRVRALPDGASTARFVDASGPDELVRQSIGLGQSKTESETESRRNSRMATYRCTYVHFSTFVRLLDGMILLESELVGRESSLVKRELGRGPVAKSGPSTTWTSPTRSASCSLAVEVGACWMRDERPKLGERT